MVNNMRKICLFIVINSFFIYSYSAEGNAELKIYIDKLIAEVSKVLNDQSANEGAKIAKSQDLLVSNLDLSWMAKYTLGRYRKGLTQSQIDNFIQIYSKYVTISYTDLVKNYKGEQWKIVNIHKIDEDSFIVTMTITKSQNQPTIKVEYFVRQVQNNNQHVYKVSDIITEGVSMINSQQAEFTNILENSGFDALITQLKNKHK
jgi:phospholipid transport system substrate-binding protein